MTECGFWKATGSDRPIRSAADPQCGRSEEAHRPQEDPRLLPGPDPLRLQDQLVHEQVPPPRPDHPSQGITIVRSIVPRFFSIYWLTLVCLISQEDLVLCKVYRKATSLKELEQRAAMASLSPRSTVESVLSSDQESWHKWMVLDDDEGVKKQAKEEEEEEVENDAHEVEILTKPTRSVTLPKLEVLKHNGLEWMQDPFPTQLQSPWMDLLSPFYASVLNS